MNKINVFDPRDIPFGHLSNSFALPFELNDQKWNSVINYVYSNLVTTPIFKDILKQIRFL